MTDFTIEIERNEDGTMSWIVMGVDKKYSGFWQTAETSLTEEELNLILTLLENKTKNIYIRK